MVTIHAPRVMVAGMSSGSGKTTLTCALLGALKDTAKVTAFKCGPDFIDPMFHSETLGIPSRNLDSFLCGERGLLDIFCRNAGEISIIEGVMGFYDGIGATSRASTYEISELTTTPVLLSVNCKGTALSIAAVVSGFQKFRQNNIKGIILNGIKHSSYEFYKKIIEENTGLKVYGYLPDIPETVFSSRHLGLVTAAETSDITCKLTLLRDAALQHIDIAAIAELARTAHKISYNPIAVKKIGDCRIGVARDKAFCFYYRDNFELLERLGAELIYFSPLSDSVLPENIDALIFGGGYPEIHTEALSQNQTFMASVRGAAAAMPIVAECGGFMYLHEFIGEYPAVGVIKGVANMTESLKWFGYHTIEAWKDNLLCRTGDKINVHEFHYSDSTAEANSFDAVKASNGARHSAIYTDENVFAGYPHMHFYSNISFAENFVRAAIAFRERTK